MGTDINSQVRAYCGTCGELARSLVGKHGAEEEDLVQECLIEVWQALGRGITPAREPLRNRMKDWVKLIGRQAGTYAPAKCSRIDGECPYVGYDQLLPLDDFRTAEKVDSAVAAQQERDADVERLG